MSRFMVVATALLAAAPAHAQDLVAGVDRMFSWVTPASPGCAIAASQNGKLLVSRAYGLADLKTNAPITATTLFDIGSVQKQFVAATVLLLAEDGRLALTDDIRKYIPELPDYGHRVTIDHLLTHTSGIRDWVGLMQFSAEPGSALSMILRQRQLNFAPGAEWSYSNSNYVLAKEIVARVTGKPFAEVLRERVFAPLGMKRSVYAEDVTKVADAALGYDKRGETWQENMMLGEERGGGGLFSNAEEMLIWNDALSNGRLGKFVTAKLQEPARLNNGRELTYARGLMIDPNNRVGRIVYHSGSALSYKAMAARYPQQQDLSVVSLCNAGEESERTNFSRGIVNLVVPASVDLTQPLPTGIDGVDVSGRDGLFFSERHGQALRVAVADGRIRIPGGPTLIAVASDRFRNPEAGAQFYSNDMFELHYVSNDLIEMKSQEGDVTRYRRAVPFSPTLSDYVGTYHNDEVNATFGVTAGPNGLMININGGQPIPFAPVDRDTFMRSNMVMRFQRDAAGKVVAIQHTNPVLRNVIFVK